MRKRQWMADKLGAGLTRITTTVAELRGRVTGGASGPSRSRLTAVQLPVTPSREPGSPPRSSSPRQRDIGGIGDAPVLVLDGRVLDRCSRPVADVRLDVWQEAGDPPVHCQGRQVTGVDGRFQLTAPRLAGEGTSVVPHLNVMLKAPGCPPLTTRLYFPDRDNRSDPLYDPSLLLSYREQTPYRLHARFDFVVPDA